MALYHFVMFFGLVNPNTCVEVWNPEFGAGYHCEFRTPVRGR